MIIYSDSSPKIACLSLNDCKSIRPKGNEQVVNTILENVPIGSMLLDNDKNILYAREKQTNKLLIIKIGEVEADINYETIELNHVDS